MKLVSLFCATLLALSPRAASAGGLEDTTHHQRFECLQRERELEPLPDKKPTNRNQGTLRFKLRFTHPEKPPRVELIHGGADDDMEDVARRYLAGYRLPCLHEKDHPVEVVQEFSFNRWGHEPPVPLESEAAPLKAYMPPGGPRVAPFGRFDYGKSLVEFRFLEGKAEPELRFLFASVGNDAQQAIEHYMSQYRLIDAGGRPFPVVGTQTFAFVDPETRGTKYRLTKDDFKLLEFLGMVKNLREHLVDMDLDSMGCPFALRITLRQPYQPNGVHQIGSLNPNRAYLLDWLSKLHMRYASEAQQKDLFDTDVRVTVPCGRLDLTVLAKPATPASAP